MKKETINSIMILSFFFIGLTLLIINFISKQGGLIYSIGLGLFATSLIIGLFEFLRNKK